MKILNYIALLCVWVWSSSAIAFETTAVYAVAMDHKTGVVIFDKAAHEKMYPASMTKMMTAHLMFEALKDGRIKLTDTYTVSENAWSKQGSKMFVPLGASVSVEDLMHGIVIQSGNDACITFAEGFAGSEERFAERMTKEAKEIGMKNTVFKNATGWPDPEHVTTVYDLALLARNTIAEYPEYYKIYAVPDYTYNGIHQYNRNLLLSKNLGVDGLKTGHTEDAGYGITISGIKDGRRMEVVVAGLSSEKERAAEAEKLYNYAFAESRNIQPAKDGKILASLPVWYGEAATVSVTTDNEAFVTLPTVETQGLKASVSYSSGLKAPIKKGQKVGILKISHPAFSEQSIDLFATQDVLAGSFFKRLITNLHLLTTGT